MLKLYTTAILLINQSNEIGEKQYSVFGSRGGHISPLMHVPFYIRPSVYSFVCLYTLFLFGKHTTTNDVPFNFCCFYSYGIRVPSVCLCSIKYTLYSRTCVKWPFAKRQKIGFQDQLSLHVDQTYCIMLQGEHSAIL